MTEEKITHGIVKIGTNVLAYPILFDDRTDAEALIMEGGTFPPSRFEVREGEVFSFRAADDLSERFANDVFSALDGLKMNEEPEED